MPILVFFPLAVLQLTVVPFIALGSIVPNLIIILLVYFTIKNGQVYGTVLGSVIGLLFDIVSGGILGAAMFSMTLTGFIAGYFFNENRIDYYSTTFFLLIIFICSFAHSLVFLFLSSSEIKLSISHLVLEQGLLPGIFTTVISLPIVFLTQRKRRM